MRRNSPGYESAGAILSRPGAEYGAGGPKERVSYCQDCVKVNVLSPLKDRIYLDENGKIDTNPPPSDSKNWRQCYHCGTIVPVYEAKTEAELISLSEPRDNPFKFGRGIIQAVGESRKFDRSCKTQHKRKFKQDLEQYKEEDVKQALRKGAKLLKYQESK